MATQFAIFSSPTGALIADYSTKVQDLTVSTGPRGFAECSGFIPMGLAEAFLLYDRAGLPHVVFADNTADTVYAGRLEDVRIVSTGVHVRAFGYARALGDVPYTEMWSVSSLEDFTKSWMISTSGGPTLLRDYEIDAAADAINIGLIKNTIYQAAQRGEMAYQIPSGSTRNITGFMVDYAFLANANMAVRVSSWPLGYPFATATANPFVLAGTGALQTGTVFVTCNTPVITFGMICSVLNTYAGETGAEYVKFSNIRLVSSTTNQFSRGLQFATAAGSNVTATLGTTAELYVGQRVAVNQGAATAESVVVKTIPSGTTFTADFAKAHAAFEPVQGFRIFADEIVSDLLGWAQAANTTQLSTSTSFIQSPGIDLLSETYEDRSPDDILDYLIGLGDTQVPPREWEWGVYDAQMLYFRPQGTAGRTWHIDLADIDVDRTLDQLANSQYAIYQDTDGNTVRSTTATDSDSVTRYGLTRRRALQVNTTNANVAAIHRDTALQDGKDPPPRSSISLTRIYDVNGARWPLRAVRAGDTVVLRNLAPTLSTTIDRIRTFRLTRTEYDAETDTLKIEPEVPRPTLDALLARLAIGLTP